MKKFYYFLVFFLVIVFYINVRPQTSPDSLFIHYTLDMECDRAKPFLTLHSLLEYLPGIYQFGVQTPGQSQSLLMNGTRDNHSVILIDGLPLYDYIKGTPHLPLIPVETVKKIELYPGLNPYGINAIGGVVNITTKKLMSNKPYTKFVYRTGSGFFSDFDVTYGQRIGSKIKILSGVMMKKFGEKKSTNEILPYRKYNAQKTRTSFEYSLNDFTKFQYSILSNRHNLTIPFNIPFEKDSTCTPSKNIFRIDHTLQSSFDLPRLQTNLWLNHTSEEIKIKEFRFYPQKKFSYLSNQIKLLQRMNFIFPLSWGLTYSHCNLTDTSSTKNSFHQENIFINLHLPLSDNIRVLTELNFENSKFTLPVLKFSGLFSYVPTNTLNLTIEYDQNSNLPELPKIHGFPIFFSTPLSNNENKFRKYNLSYNKNSNLFSENSERIQLFCQYGKTQNQQLSTLIYYQTCNNLVTINQLNQDSESLFTFDNSLSTEYAGINTTISLEFFNCFSLSSSLNLIRSLQQDTLHHIDLPDLQGLTTLSWNHDFFKNDLHVTLFASLKYWSGFSLFSLTNAHTFTKQLILPNAFLNVKASFKFMDHTYITVSADNILNQKISDKYHVFIPHSFVRFGISWELFN
ncbi:MAG: TonB-dependent receptor plug domain-containing protein [bacterium]